MINPVNGKIGDKVEYERRQAGMVKATLVMFLLPLVLVTIGAIAGYNLTLSLGINDSVGGFIGGALFLALSVVIIRLYDNHVANSPSSKPIITRIL